MPTPEAEEITKAIATDLNLLVDMLSVVQRHAPKIDALVLRKVTEMESSWRTALRVEREARDRAITNLRRDFERILHGDRAK